MNTLLK